MRRILLLAVVVVAGLPAHALAQHCWPVSVALLVRDGAGKPVARERLDSVAYTPQPSRDADFAVQGARIDLNDGNAASGPTPVIHWYGRGACRVDLREVVLYRQGVVMRLWMDLHVNSLTRPGSSQYVLDTPPLAPGTWRLDVCGPPDGRMNAFAAIPPRWVRVSASGDPGVPWQAPQGCGAAAAR
jgi:hypothetical protein